MLHVNPLVVIITVPTLIHGHSAIEFCSQCFIKQVLTVVYADELMKYKLANRSLLEDMDASRHQMYAT